MSPNRFALAALLCVCAIAPASAACPAPAAGDTAEALEANQQRLVCLQRELAQNGEQYRFKVEINALDQAVQQIQLQRRFDALTFPSATPPGF